MKKIVTSADCVGDSKDRGMRMTDRSTHIITTIVERDYLFGAAVLYNSLVANGFDGTFVVWCRNVDDLPADLVQQIQKLDGSLPSILFRTLQTNRHLAMHKATCMVACFQEFSAACNVIYIDPDIVVQRCPWRWMQTWSDHGVVLAADVNWHISSSHPSRQAWQDLLEQKKLGVKQRLETYFNAGFVGIARKDLEFCVLWAGLIDRFGATNKALELLGEVKDWPRHGRWEAVELPDQDTLNMAVTSWSGKLVAFGPDCMGFAAGICLLPHAVGGRKPWKRNYLRDALRGTPPGQVDKEFWANAHNPISLLSPRRLSAKRWSITLASLLGRFMRRG